MMRWLILLVALLADAAMAGVQDLRQQAEAFAGRPVAIDPRLPVPDCQPFRLAWRGDNQSAIVASCPESSPDSNWRMVFPVAARPAGVGSAAGNGSGVAAVADIKRGDPVQVRVLGNGFRLLVDGVAMGNAGPGRRVVVRNLSSGRQMIAEVMADGSLELAGKNF